MSQNSCTKWTGYRQSCVHPDPMETLLIQPVHLDIGLDRGFAVQGRASLFEIAESMGFVHAAVLQTAMSDTSILANTNPSFELSDYG